MSVRVLGELRRPLRSLKGAAAKSLRSLASIREDPLRCYWYRGRRNFGDLLSPWLVETIAGRPVVHPADVYNWRSRPVIAAVGSVLMQWPAESLIVWGSGFLRESASFVRRGGSTRPPDLRAVRGPLTRALAIAQGVPCPAIYGDPALLLPQFHTTHVTPEFELGLVPHMNDRDSSVLQQLAQHPGTTTIDVQDEGLVVVDQIRRCRVIASTSLHGVVVAIAYGIPALWIEVSDRVQGGGFKFRDFFGSIGSPILEPFRPTLETHAEELIARAAVHAVDLDLSALLGAFPHREQGRAG